MKFENRSVMICTPSYEGFRHIDFLMSLFRLYEYSKYELKNDIEWIPLTGANIYGIRNKAMKMFKESRHHTLLMVDNDMVFHHEILKSLFEKDKDIIMPIFTNKVGNMPEMNKRIVSMAAVKYKDGKLRQLTRGEIESSAEPIRVATNGFGMVLIKRRVIEGVDYPYCQGIPMPQFEQSEQGICGEDYYFCIKALEKGFEIWLDTTNIVIHLGIKPFGIWDVGYEAPPKIESVIQTVKPQILVPA